MQGLPKLMEARSKLEKRIQSQKSAFKVRKVRPGQKNAPGHRLGASGSGTGSRQTASGGLLSPQVGRLPCQAARCAPSRKTRPETGTAFRGPARPNKKEQSPSPYTVRSIVLSAIFAARCLLCVTAMTAMLRFSASDRTRSQICACVITSSIVLISSQIR